MKRLAIFVGLALVALGPVAAGSARTYVVAGTLDQSFGYGSIVTHSPVPNKSVGIDAIAVQPDGKIVAAAASGQGQSRQGPGNDGLLLARYVPDGQPDTSFGDGGYVQTQVGDWANAASVAVQPDGKIVVAGTRSPQGGENVGSEFVVARYNADGSLDTSFGTGGIVSAAIPESPPPSTPGNTSLPPFADAASLAILPSGEILVSGSAGFEVQSDSLYGTYVRSFFTLARFEPDGSLDTAFGEGGIVQTRFDGDLTLSGIAVTPDGKIVAVGSASGGEHPYYTSRMVAARYNADGSLDPTFGTGGKVATSAALYFGGGPFAVLPDGKIVVSGTNSDETDRGSTVFARFTADGHIDQSFGKRGYAKVNRPAPSHIAGLRNGKIVFVTNDSTDGVGVSTFYRLFANGRLDTSFGPTEPLKLPGLVSTLAVQPDQRILVGGGDGDMWTLTRLVASGTNCVVPNVRSQTVATAMARLKKSHCGGFVFKIASKVVARGHVVSTYPLAGTHEPGGSSVLLDVSRGSR